MASRCLFACEMLQKTVLDNLRSMLSKRPAPDDRKKVLEFYQKLIENVDAVWNGAAEPIPEVVNLMKKIQQGLKDVLPPLNAEQHSKTVLTILREKLVRRIAEVSERERKLADAEKFLTKPPEEVLQAELNIPSPLSDVLWNEAMNQTPKRQNLIKLQGMYDGALVEKFIQLLAHEKGKIIEKFKKQYEKSVRCMKQNLQDRISYAVNAYVIAREDWAEISSLLENVQNAHRAALQAPGEPPSTEQWKVVNQLMDQLRESQEHYEGEIQRGEDLRMLLVAEHQSSHLMKLIAGNNLQQLQNDHSELCDAIHQLALEIRQQHKRIEELQNLLQ
ncbi:hypothetical protein R5R35_004469 [Gryllus longicercus]|uniref:Uncharacterized protein n=1 Tax=Gryllus longicercus TaxID=2509291 RepID=A0AAN9V7J5_9ORTH